MRLLSVGVPCFGIFRFVFMWPASFFWMCNLLDAPLLDATCCVLNKSMNFSRNDSNNCASSKLHIQKKEAGNRKTKRKNAKTMNTNRKKTHKNIPSARSKRRRWNVNPITSRAEPATENRLMRNLIATTNGSFFGSDFFLNMGITRAQKQTNLQMATFLGERRPPRDGEHPG